MKTKILSFLLALCLIVGLLPLAAFAADGDYITVRFDRDGTRLWNGKYTVGMEPKYAITAEDGAISDGTADNWNVKLEYPDDNGAILTLKDATLKYSAPKDDFPCMISGTANITVKVETDSSITANGRTAMYFALVGDAVATITGPGRLSIINDGGDGAGITFGNAKNFDGGKLVFKDADVEIKPNATSTTRYAIGFTNKEGIEIDNSKINIVAGSQCMGISGLALVESDADGNPTKVSCYWTSKGNDIQRNLVIKNGSVVTGNASSREFLAATGDIIISDSTVEAESTKNVFGKKPTLEGEYSAVGGSKKEKLSAYAPGKATSYKYFKIVPGTVNLLPTEATTAPTEPAPTEPVVVPTEPVTVPSTEPVTVPTQPEATQAPTQAPEATQAPTKAPAGNSGNTQTPADDTASDSTGLIIALIVIGGVAVLAGATLVLLWFVIKPKWLVKTKK